MKSGHHCISIQMQRTVIIKRSHSTNSIMEEFGKRAMEFGGNHTT